MDNKMTRSTFRTTTIGILYLLLSTFALAVGTGPRIRFQELTWDFGKTKERKVLMHRFSFENTGDSPLIIDKVTTSCGCAAAMLSKRTLAPGEKGEIMVHLSTRGYKGQIEKYIIIASNDPRAPELFLTISAHIEMPPSPQIKLNRKNLDLGLLLNTQPSDGQIIIRNRGEADLLVTIEHDSAQFFLGSKLVSSDITIAPRREAAVVIKFPPSQRTGIFQEHVLIQSNDPDRPKLSLPIAAYLISKTQLRDLFQRYPHLLP